jgi:membrane protein DedA with SNARE-associated domain
MKKSNNARKWLALTAIAIEMGVVIYLFIALGKWLDTKYTEGGKLFLILGTFVGIAISLYLVIKQTNKLNSNE